VEDVQYPGLVCMHISALLRDYKSVSLVLH